MLDEICAGYPDISINNGWGEGFLPMVNCSISDENTNKKIFNMASHIMDVNENTDEEMYEVLDSACGDLEAIYSFVFDTPDVLDRVMKIVQDFSYKDYNEYDIYDMPRTLLVGIAKRYMKTDKKYFLSALIDTIKATGCHYALFQAADVSHDGTHNQEKLCEYYKSLPGMTLINEEESVFLFDYRN
jgi:hypothetical protein